MEDSCVDVIRMMMQLIADYISGEVVDKDFDDRFSEIEKANFVRHPGCSFESKRIVDLNRVFPVSDHLIEKSKAQEYFEQLKFKFLCKDVIDYVKVDDRGDRVLLSLDVVVES